MTLTISLVLALSVAGELAAQRRTTGGTSTPSGGRSTPSAGGSSTSSGSRRSSGGSTARGGSSSGGSSTARRGGGDSGGSSQPSARNGSSGTSTGSEGSSRADGSDDRPASGKIGAIRRGAERDRTRVVRGVVVGRPVYIGRCWDCDYFGWYGPRWGWYHGGYWYPAERRRRPDARADRDERDESGQGYMDYPYATSDGTGDTFVRARHGERRGFGTLTLGYFTDVGSTTQGGHVSFEGAVRGLRGELEYRQYAEPVVGGTDHLHTMRAALAVQPRLGTRAYLTAGGGVRAVFVDNGQTTAGPEGSIGLQVFPARPLGANVTGRVAALSWNGQNYFALRELNTGASVFLGRVEVQAGWHWMKMGDNPAFGGPMLATRIWF